MLAPLMPPIGRYIWQTRYRGRSPAGTPEHDMAETWRRVARAAASVEPDGQDAWARRFEAALDGFAFLPGGRILAGAGRSDGPTLFNCFVMGPIEDAPAGIARALEESAATLRLGGGIGCDFSPARPRGPGSEGPVGLMDRWNAMSEMVSAGRARAGAMMATLRCDHPDIADFIAAKRRPGRLRHFNTSVLVTDAFMRAVADDAPWPLAFGSGVPARQVPARGLWRDLARAAYDAGDPGVLFIDRINRANNLAYRERITATNPCGEVPLPPYGACNLGSMNLPRFIRQPFSDRAALDADALARGVEAAVRLLDNVIDISPFPLPQQRDLARQTRRIGLGITGLADALMLLGLRYDSAAARAWARGAMAVVCHAAYRASVALAREKGPFPALDRARHLAGPFVAALPDDIRDGIARHGIRNSHLTAIAPAGSISLLAGNVSSGIEPVLAPDQRRTIRRDDGGADELALTDAAVALWRAGPGRKAGVPPALVCADALTPAAHLDMQAALQPLVDSAISKTITLSADAPPDAGEGVFLAAWERGLKGCTLYRRGLAGPVLPAPCAAAECRPDD